MVEVMTFQTTTWTNDDPVHRHIIEPAGLNELTPAQTNPNDLILTYPYANIVVSYVTDVLNKANIWIYSRAFEDILDNELGISPRTPFMVQL